MKPIFLPNSLGQSVLAGHRDIIGILVSVTFTSSYYIIYQVFKKLCHSTHLMKTTLSYMNHSLVTENNQHLLVPEVHTAVIPLDTFLHK